MPTPRTVLVSGATGKQGGAVAHRLLERGHTVRAITRHPDSAPARALAAKGATVLQADMLDRSALDAAAHGVDTVFAMSTPFEAGTEAETRQGVTLADAGARAGAFVVYTSVANADRGTGVPHFDSKHAVERHLQAIGARHAVIAPAYFMENVGFVRDQLRQGVFPTPLSAGRKLAQVALSDIATVAVAVIEDPERHTGARYDLAGDELSAEEQIAVMERVTGRTLAYFQLPMDMVRHTMGDDGVRMYEFFERSGYAVDREQLRAAFPGLRPTTFEAWARSFDWEAIFGGASGGGGRPDERDPRLAGPDEGAPLVGAAREA